MLLKLLKWDLRNQKEILILYGLMIVLGLMSFLSFEIDLSQAFTAPRIFLYLATVLIHAISPFLIVLISAIYYYRNMHGSSGYLHHSIPATTNEKLWSKWLSFFIYMGGAIAIIMMNIGLITSFTDAFPMIIPWGEIFNQMARAFQITPFLLGTILVILGLLTLFSNAVTYAAIVTIGSTGWFQKKGKLGILLSYVLLIVVGYIVSFLGFSVPLNFLVEVRNNALEIKLTGMSIMELMNENVLPLGVFLTSFLFAVLLMVLIKHLLNKKLNVT